MELYNGKTLEEIGVNFHPDMTQYHRDLYINNCKEVIKNESACMNKGYCEQLKYSNFLLVNFYYTGQHKQTNPIR